VGELEKYSISFAGLKEGKHFFNFNIEPSFFAHFEKSEIQNGNLHVLVEMEKKPRILELNFRIKGKVEVLCDRCLDPFNLPVKSDNFLFIKFGKEKGELSDELLVLDEKEYKIDLTQYIYEYILLSLPCHRVHPVNTSGKSGCNPKMIERLNKYLVTEESSHNSTPLWNELKTKLKLKN